MSIIQPEWMYRVIVGLTEYEDTHPDPRRDGGICLMNLLDLVPKDVQRDAALFMAGVEAAGGKSADAEPTADAHPEPSPACREMPTRDCTNGPCGDGPCARFETEGGRG